MVSDRRVLVAPDSFKGTFTALEVAKAIGSGFTRSGWTVDLAPVADGGEGTAGVLADAFGATWHPCTVSGPLGAPVDTGFYVTADGAALVDTAAASGLSLVPPDRLDPSAALASSTSGTGQLIVDAVAAGAREIVLGVGGSATTDGGRGAVDAVRGAGGLRGIRLRVLCDVTTHWLDAPVVFGPQKGADAGTVAELVARLNHYADQLPRDPRDVPMAGAAGGLAGGLWAAFGATLVPGADEVLRAVRVRERAAGAALVVTGEGRFDTQSALGKLVGAVRDASPRPTHLVVGSTELDRDHARSAGFASLRIAGDLDALVDAGRALAEACTGRG